jgi:histidyl-tRNA synthetase
LFSFSGTNAEKVAKMTDFLSSSEIGLKGIEELQFVFDQVTSLGLQKAELEFDITLARGLNYYTGAIFEVKANGVKMGSICGGGRYDDLTGLFGMKGMSGVGISFGADRIYDVLTELELFPKETDQGLTLLFTNFGEKEQAHCMKLVHAARANGIDCELYPSSAKLQKQMKYANDRNVLFVALVGEQEMQQQLIQLKNMETGEQTEVSIDELIFKLSNKN